MATLPSPKRRQSQLFLNLSKDYFNTMFLQGCGALVWLGNSFLCFYGGSAMRTPMRTAEISHFQRVLRVISPLLFFCPLRVVLLQRYYYYHHVFFLLLKSADGSVHKKYGGKGSTRFPSIAQHPFSLLSWTVVLLLLSFSLIVFLVWCQKMMPTQSKNHFLLLMID